jgi:uncharacterized DUF497 family protein
VRFTFDHRKSRLLRTNPKRGIGFEEAQELFSQPYWLHQRSDVPEQYLAVGQVGGRLYSVIFEFREDEEGEILHLVTCGSRRERKPVYMKKIRKPSKPISAEAIARLADQGKDISGFFKGQGRMVQPIQRVNVDLTATMLKELDSAAEELNVSRQAVIKTLVRQGLDQHYLARQAKQSQPEA